jgi:probable F420-dependent oxidoreductase
MARYGVRLENDPQLTPQDYQELARLAEELGYETVWVPEGGGRDSLTSLASIALRTERIKLGTGILPIFARTPINTAMGAAGMAAVSGDRFILGLGVGHRPTVEARDGVPFKQPMTRLRETIQIVRKLLAGEQVDFPGKHFQLSGASLGAAAPTTKVPIYIAALGPQMLEMAGELADGVLMNWTAAAFIPQAVAHIKRGADKAGRDMSEIDIAGYVRVAVGNDLKDDLAEARASLQRQIARYATNTFYANFFIETGFENEMKAAAAALTEGDLDKASEAITPEMQDQVAVLGTPGQCREELERRRAAGLQLPVIAPFAVGDNKTSHQLTIEALAP